MKHVCKIALILLCLLGLAATAVAADGTVTYVGGADGFILAPGSEYAPTDLFDGFKELIPGDSVTQRVIIRNDAAKDVKIKVYMRSLGAQADTAAFLSQMQLTVTAAGDTRLFAAPADRTAQLTDWVELGTVYSGGEIPLDVTVTLPVTMGNEWQGHAGYIDWQFKVEEYPVDPDDPKPPTTGDNNALWLYGGAAAVSVVGLTVIVILLTRRKKDEDDAE